MRHRYHVTRPDYITRIGITTIHKNRARQLLDTTGLCLFWQYQTDSGRNTGRNEITASHVMTLASGVTI